MQKLKSLKVLVTRPLHQTQQLSTKITALGGQPILFPTIAIEDATDQEILYTHIQQLDKQNIAIFISPNAVQKTAPIIHQYWSPWPAAVKIGAIGISTAQALHACRLHADFYPKEKFSSEELIALPFLQSIANKKIIVFRGEGGRELLTDVLRQRGAEVTEAVTYRRVLPKQDLSTSLETIDCDVVVCTSQTSLQNLLILAGPVGRQRLLNMPLLVSSQRLAGFAHALGFVKSVLIADNASDDALIKTLINWREN
jgi:uroporphyrinogen-III synthase